MLLGLPGCAHSSTNTFDVRHTDAHYSHLCNVVYSLPANTRINKGWKLRNRQANEPQDVMAFL